MSNKVVKFDSKSDLKNQCDKKTHECQSVNKFPQFFYGFLANIVSFATGTAYGWSSPVGVKLTSNTTHDTPLSDVLSSESDEYAWIISIFEIGSLTAPFIAGFLADRIGRKWTLFISANLFAVSYVILMFAYEVWIMSIGRFIQGCAEGFVISVQPMYIGEIATDMLRGVLGSYMTLFIAGGILYTQAVGTFVSYYTLQGVCLIIPIISFIALFIIPESPFYYVSKGRSKEAAKSLRKLGHPIENIPKQLDTIHSFIEESKKNTGSFRDIFQKKGNIRAFLICFGLITAQMVSGLEAISFNTQLIFEKAKTGIDSGLSSIVVSICSLVACCFAPLILGRFGRKVILLITISTTVLALTCLGLFFYLDGIGVDTKVVSWLPLVSLIIFCASISIGVVPIPYTIIGEIFLQNVKAKASSILAMYSAIMAFIFTRYFPVLQALGGFIAFWMFAVLSGLSFVFVLTSVFETKGLTLQDIQNKLNNR